MGTINETPDCLRVYFLPIFMFWTDGFEVGSDSKFTMLLSVLHSED